MDLQTYLLALACLSALSYLVGHCNNSASGELPAWNLPSAPSLPVTMAIRAVGQKQKFVPAQSQTLERPLNSETRLIGNSCFSAITAIGLRRSIGQQSAAYLPFHLEWSRTAASISGECVLRAHCGHPAFSRPDGQANPGFTD